MTLAVTVTKRRERDMQRAILALLHARGVVAWKAGSGGFRVKDTSGRERYVKMGHTGVADIIGLTSTPTRFDDALKPAGTFLAIEVKRPGAATTLEQELFLDSVLRAGGIAFVARSGDDVARALGWA